MTTPDAAPPTAPLPEADGEPDERGLVRRWDTKKGAYTWQVAGLDGLCEALGFDPTNHHNALKCPYCNPKQIDPEAAIAQRDELLCAVAHQVESIELLQEERDKAVADLADARAKLALTEGALQANADWTADQFSGVTLDVEQTVTVWELWRTRRDLDASLIEQFRLGFPKYLRDRAQHAPPETNGGVS